MYLDFFIVDVRQRWVVLPEMVVADRGIAAAGFQFGLARVREGGLDLDDVIRDRYAFVEGRVCDAMIGFFFQAGDFRRGHVLRCVIVRAFCLEFCDYYGLGAYVFVSDEELVDFFRDRSAIFGLGGALAYVCYLTVRHCLRVLVGRLRELNVFGVHFYRERCFLVGGGDYVS